jgi:hypothetical protein
MAMCLKNGRPGCLECMSGMGSPIELCDSSGWEFWMERRMHAGQSSHSRSLNLFEFVNDMIDMFLTQQLTEISMHHKRPSLNVHYWDFHALMFRNFQERLACNVSTDPIK